MRRALGLFIAAGFAFTALHAFADGGSKKPSGAKSPTAPAAAAAKQRKPEPSNRHYVTKRGEIVDYYCYIEKGLTGPSHRECGTKCVAGDVCMGLLTDDGLLYMISVNHMRAMDPLSFRSIPDPFTQCRTWISERVDLSGYAMERKGQRIIEIMGVTKVPSAQQVGSR